MNPPRDLSVEALDKWIERVRITSAINRGIRPGAAVRSLVEEKVTEALSLARQEFTHPGRMGDRVYDDPTIVSRIMGQP